MLTPARYAHTHDRPVAGAHASAYREELVHPLAPHGWHMDPLVLVEGGDNGSRLVALDDIAA